MNIHPLFVHFPIGILTLYILFEIFRFRFITKQPYYFELKAILVVFGTIAGYLAVMTGGMAEDLAESGANSVVSQSDMPLIMMHVIYAVLTIAIFSLLAFSYLFEYMRKQRILSRLTNIGFCKAISKHTQRFALPLALLGALTMLVAGGLGAALVYGPDIDPMVSIISNLFGPSL